MRLIGYLPDEDAAATFRDFLYVHGIASLIEAEKDRWAVWIHSEDELERARGLLQSYADKPNDPKYRQHTREARRLKARDQQEAVAAEKRHFDRRRLLQATLPHGVGPLTLSLIVVCSGLWIYFQVSGNQSLYYALLMSQGRQGLSEIMNGQVWRLFTPILLHLLIPVHLGLMHLLFNMLWLFDLGSMIEGRQGTGRLLTLVLVIAVLSNLGQYVYRGPDFVGISGVVYGLLGYVWMKGKFDPASGLFLHPQTVTMMLIWFFLCLTPLMGSIVGNIANGAHAVGLAAGLAWGYMGRFFK